jgi:hypothetical protein
MKTKLAQLVIYVNNIDRHYIQFAYFAIMLAGMFIIQSPSDGGVGPV